MKNRPIIGIIPTSHYSDTDPYGDQTSFVNMYSNMIVACGGIPVGLTALENSLYLDFCDGFLWPGGKRIESRFYQVIKHAMITGKPLLGICLGSQAIATYFNVLNDQEKMQSKSFFEVYQSLKSLNPYLKDVENHYHPVTKDIEAITKVKHLVRIKEHSILYSIYKQKQIEVPSLHTKQIARTPSNILVSAESLDGVIEAVEYTDNNALILGVQWHPELIKDYKIFSWLINNCRKDER